MINNKLCILIVDDEKRMAEGLADFFEDKDYHVIMAHDGEAALDVYYANNQNIDIVLLDVMMPVMNGFEVLKELREGGDEVPVIMLTAKSTEYDQLEGFNHGADDYVCKPFLPTVLHARMESVIKRVYKSVDKNIAMGPINLSVAKGNVEIDGGHIELTRREYELLYYLILNRNIALSREQIVTSVWGYDFEGDARTVDTHVKQLRVKLGRYAAMIRTVHRLGYIMEEINEG